MTYTAPATAPASITAYKLRTGERDSPFRFTVQNVTVDISAADTERLAVYLSQYFASADGRATDARKTT